METTQITINYIENGFLIVRLSIEGEEKWIAKEVKDAQDVLQGLLVNMYPLG